jgi:FkbM family methyltransferase
MIKKLIRQAIQRCGYRYFKIAYQPIGLDHAYDVARFLGSAKNLRVVFDVGANEGQSVEHYVRAFPCAQIYSFEPFAGAYESLVRRVSNFARVRTFQLAFADTNRAARIQPAALSVQNSLRNELSGNCSSKGGELVVIKTLESFCAEQDITHIDLLKTDTEGFDLEVLKGAEAMLRSHRIQFIFSEASLRPDDSYHTSFFRVTEYLSRFGYSFVDLYDHAFVSSAPTRPPLDYCNALFTAWES